MIWVLVVTTLGSMGTTRLTAEKFGSQYGCEIARGAELHLRPLAATCMLFGIDGTPIAAPVSRLRPRLYSVASGV